MKPMTTDEIQRLKVWAEKQQTRRPNEILYQDILRLIATIEEESKGSYTFKEWLILKELRESYSELYRSIESKVNEQCGNPIKRAERAVNWATTPHHWQRWEAYPGKCGLCGQHLNVVIHMPQLPDQDPSIIAKLDPDGGDLKSALTAIRPNLDPANQALIDALIEGEGK